MSTFNSNNYYLAHSLTISSLLAFILISNSVAEVIVVHERVNPTLRPLHSSSKPNSLIDILCDT